MTAIIQHQFNMVAREYDANRRKFIPCFDDFYKSATDFIAHSIDTEPNLIYDLGSGTGLLPSFWFRHFPKARYVLIDIADEMLNVARRRFTEMANVTFESMDYSDKLPVGCPDIIISALSIHHLEHERKRRLFNNIWNILPINGIFVNYDQFCAESSEMDSKIEAYWTTQIKSSGLSLTEYERWQERKKLDRECTMSQETKWLSEAGFGNVDCIYMNGKFGIVAAKKTI